MKLGWEIYQLGQLGKSVRDVAALSEGSEYELWSVPSFANDEPEFVTGREIGSSKLRVSPGDILICKINPRINRVWRVREAITGCVQIASPEWLVFRPNEHAGLVPGWLIHFLSSPKFREWIEAEVTGATGSHARAKADGILGQRLPVPTLPEQHRIVALLNVAFEGIATAKANAEKNLKNARELFESRREALLTSAVHGWVEAPLSDLCDIKHGYAFEGEFFAQEGDYVLLTPGNYFESGGYRDRAEKQKYFTGPIPSNYILEEGSLLVAMTEQAAGLLGSPLLVPESDRFLHNQRLGLVVGKPGIAWANEFFFHVFNLKRMRAEIHARASGVKVRHTSPSKIGAVRVAFPTTVTDQREIASRLDKLAAECDRLVLVYERKLDALDELKKSLLHQAFTGKLIAEVTTDLAEVNA